VSPWERLGAYVHPGLRRQASQPAPADWTVATHHFLVADVRHCTVCGARPEVLDQVLARCGRVGIAVLSCLPCRSADPQRERMREKLEARYAAGRLAPNNNGGADGEPTTTARRHRLL